MFTFDYDCDFSNHASWVISWQLLCYPKKDGVNSLTNLQSWPKLTYYTLQIDADQLEVQLGQDRVELRDLLLRCEYINDQLVSYQNCHQHRLAMNIFQTVMTYYVQNLVFSVYSVILHLDDQTLEVQPPLDYELKTCLCSWLQFTFFSMDDVSTGRSFSRICNIVNWYLALMMMVIIYIIMMIQE